VKFSDFELLFKTSRIAGIPISGLHKLTKTHLYPTSFKKMNVRLAAQVLYNSVATAFQYFRKQENTKASFEGRLNKISRITAA
jgi:hypothetical protein